MKELVIISGKGGTGKTSLVSSLTALTTNKIVVDCDVDAANLHLILKPEIKESHEFYGGKKASINPSLCISCNQCKEVCHFSAIFDTEEAREINPILCEGCGACTHFCPTEAITLKDSLSGHWFISDTAYGPLIHAKLGIAEDNSGKLVNLIRSQARILAQKEKADLIIIDGSPGVGCPVIASITGADFVLVVSEPTLSGKHDLERVIQLTEHFGIKAGLIINKGDLNPQVVEEIKEYCHKKNIPLFGVLPYDETAVKAQVEGKPITSYNSPLAEEIKKTWFKISKILKEEEL